MLKWSDLTSFAYLLGRCSFFVGVFFSFCIYFFHVIFSVCRPLSYSPFVAGSIFTAKILLSWSVKLDNDIIKIRPERCDALVLKSKSDRATSATDDSKKRRREKPSAIAMVTMAAERCCDSARCWWRWWTGAVGGSNSDVGKIGIFWQHFEMITHRARNCFHVVDKKKSFETGFDRVIISVSMLWKRKIVIPMRNKQQNPKALASQIRHDSLYLFSLHLCASVTANILLRTEAFPLFAFSLAFVFTVSCCNCLENFRLFSPCNPFQRWNASTFQFFRKLGQQQWRQKQLDVVTKSTRPGLEEWEKCK